MDSIIDYGGYDSDLEEPPEKKPTVEPGMDSRFKPAYKTVTEQLGGFSSSTDKELWKVQAFHLRKMDAFSRHQELIRNYIKLYGGKIEDFDRDKSKDKNDYTVLQENHKFLWDDDKKPLSWEQQLAKRYYDKLFKEYCIADLSRFEDKKIALRWRIEKEVKSGKGQFVCGNKHCSDSELLCSWEINFAYVEENVKKNALVKIRLCPDCSIKLNMVKKSNRVKKKKKEKKRKRKRKSSDQQSVTDAEVPSSSGKAPSPSEEHLEDAQDNIWKGPAPETLVKTSEEQMDDFLDDLLL